MAVNLPDKQLTLVILTNTDSPYRGVDPSTALAAAITVTTREYVYAVSQ